MKRTMTAALITVGIALVIGAMFLTQHLDSGEAAPRTPAAGPTATTTGPTLEVGHVVAGGIQPVKVGHQVSEYVRTGYLVADQDPPCDGPHWSWAAGLPAGLSVAVDEHGRITALGSRTAAVNAGNLGIGSTLAELKAAYGEFLSPVTRDDEGSGWVSATDAGAWISFSLGSADEVTAASRVDYVEVGKGAILHHFVDAC